MKATTQRRQRRAIIYSERVVNNMHIRLDIQFEKYMHFDVLLCILMEKIIKNVTHSILESSIFVCTEKYLGCS